jgi:dTDP-4-amino-4,6-dideoxy-D-galactose acyltransferase
LFAAQLSGPMPNDAVLAANLRLARATGVQLLVWPAQSGREVSQELLGEFSGVLVDRKATFTRLLLPVLSDDDLLAFQSSIVPYTAATASPALIELAISAGAYSRFRADSRICRQKFELMYERWIERSVTKELADAVMVAPLTCGDATDQRLGGVITVAESGGVASIGLIAVAQAVRGKGIGSCLLHAAHRWMRDRGAYEARVVTQLANLPACRLYERSGYRLLRVQNYYHFWL